MDIIVRDNPEMDINKVIAENLSAWMESDPKLNSMKAVRKISGIGYGTVQRAKSGSGNNTIESLVAIAAAFKKDVVDLLTPAEGLYANGGLKRRPNLLNEKTAHILDFQRNAGEHPDIVETVALMRRMNDQGKASALKHVRVIAEDFPAKAKLEQ